MSHSLAREPKSYSITNKFALQFLLEYTIDSLDKFNPKLCGEQIYSYPLFGGLRFSEDSYSRLKMVIGWLLHPGIDSILINGLGIVTIIVIPEIFTILVGLEEEVSEKSEFQHIINFFIDAIQEVSEEYEKLRGIEYKKDMTDYWRLSSILLLNESNKEIMINNNWDKGMLLNYKRNIIDYLIERIEES